MTVKDQLKILDNKIRQNQADYDQQSLNILLWVKCLIKG